MAKNFLGVDPDIPNYGAAKRAGPIRMIQDSDYQPVNDAENQIQAGIGVGAAQVIPLEDPLSYYNLIQEKIANDQIQREGEIQKISDNLKQDFSYKKSLLPGYRKQLSKNARELHQKYQKAILDGSIKNPIVKDSLQFEKDELMGKAEDWHELTVRAHSVKDYAIKHPDEFSRDSLDEFSSVFDPEIASGVKDDDELTDRITQRLNLDSKKNRDYIGYFKSRVTPTKETIDQEFGEITNKNVGGLRQAIKNNVEREFAFLEESNPYMVEEMIKKYGPNRKIAIQDLTAMIMDNIDVTKSRREDEPKEEKYKGSYGSDYYDDDKFFYKLMKKPPELSYKEGRYTRQPNFDSDYFIHLKRKGKRDVLDEVLHDGTLNVGRIEGMSRKGGKWNLMMSVMDKSSFDDIAKEKGYDPENLTDRQKKLIEDEMMFSKKKSLQLKEIPVTDEVETVLQSNFRLNGLPFDYRTFLNNVDRKELSTDRVGTEETVIENETVSPQIDEGEVEQLVKPDELKVEEVTAEKFEKIVDMVSRKEKYKGYTRGQIKEYLSGRFKVKNNDE